MIVTVKGINFIIDDEDAHLLKGRNLSVGRGYLRYSNGDGTYTMFHRLVMGVTDPNILVDHRSTEKHDNRKENLRITDNLGNSRNVSKTKRKTSSKYKGVSVTSDGQYMVSIRTGTDDGRIRERYLSEDVAGYVYNLYAIKYFGEYANLNDVTSFTEEEIKKNRVKKKSQEKQSKYKGVSWNESRQKWVAQFSHNKTKINAGRFNTEEEAYKALINKKTEMGII
ncbi:AP2/ERF family transcription factor [Bacillus paranthracis]|uniref:AP2/ERF family transcription factor n=1 Tax=Bacillus paranthracis TaxID=2026186 RepID=UPI002D776CCF|nr:AP2/ERF family transcription factor [Bacillus paranthracis]